MKAYLDILRKVSEQGIVKVSEPRGLRLTPITTRSLFCETFKHNMADGFPILTTKKVYWRSVVAELLWFLSGDKSVKELNKYTKIWEPWMNDQGEIPSAYGVRWRNYSHSTQYQDFVHRGLYGAQLLLGVTDQIQEVVNLLKRDPSSRRGVVVAWDPRMDFNSALPPCHYTFVVNIIDGKVNLHVTMRSTDVPVGLPFNIASYGLLLSLFGQWLGCELGTLAITMVDCHIYEDQMPGVAEQLSRAPGDLPTLSMPKMSLQEVSLDLVDQFRLINYQPQGFIPYPVAL